MKGKKIAKKLLKNLETKINSEIAITVSADKIYVYVGGDLVMVLTSSDFKTWYADYDDIAVFAHSIATYAVSQLLITKNAILVLITKNEVTSVIMRFVLSENNLYRLENIE